MATTLPNTGAIIPEMTEAPDQAVNNAAFTAIDAKIGGIIESGSNANGSYVKFADGTMICNKSLSLGSVAITIADGTLFMSANKDLGAWAATFYAVPICSVQCFVASGVVFHGVYAKQTISNAPTIRVLDATSATLPVTADVIAIGRWKA